MRIFKAQIVGFKWSQRHIERYRPILEYKDNYDIVRRYTMTRSIEKSPFVMKKKWYILKFNAKTYELGEIKINWFILRCFICLLSMLLMFLFPRVRIYMFGATFIYYALKTIIKINKYMRVQRVAKTHGVIGRITGYKKARKRSLFAEGDDRYEFRPIIEYVFAKQCFTHVSKERCLENQYKINQPCKIFMDMRKKKIYDEFEIQRPCFDWSWMNQEMTLLFKILKGQSYKIVDKTKEYKQTKKKGVNSNAMKGDTVPINIPLKTYDVKKASGYY